MAALGRFSFHSADSFEKKKENVMIYAKSVRILHVMACWKAL
jgi:hypothetical protein